MHQAMPASAPAGFLDRSHNFGRQTPSGSGSPEDRPILASCTTADGRRLVQTVAVLLCLGLAAGARGQEAEPNPAPTTSPQKELPQHATTTTGKPEVAASPAAAPPHHEAGSPPLTDHDPEKEWTFRFTPYIWVPATSGTVGIALINVPVNVSIGESVKSASDINFGISVEFEARRGKFALFSNVMYASVGASELNIPGPEKVDFSQDFGIFEVGAAFAIMDKPRTDDHIGIRFASITGLRLWTVGADLSSGLIGSNSASETWLDGFGGFTVDLEFNDWFGFFARADIGAGGSTLTWNVQTGVDLRFSDWGVLNLGYRWLSEDYTTGCLLNRFDFDLLMQGPYVGLSIHF